MQSMARLIASEFRSWTLGGREHGMALKKEYWQGALVAIALAVGIYFLAHGCSKKASAEAATLPNTGVATAAAATVPNAKGANAGNGNASATYDLVISGGRVMDPESKL